MVFKKMSINGVAYGMDGGDCQDTDEREVTNFNMQDTNLNQLLKQKDENNP